ncbi:hypothetical protein FisN_2Lh490 [Fistulifera solaris]|uniref:Uncharacterized protein n=1 Tax=Fistulifera solaris TaxID=1519565 RepID=A0A1Z5JAE9_FISSO|nr:hypothetical protein FisN_2Lh490 [Fistulifera solaris]|eukprot:GAX10960.1 hypothetical protein FisN_2Lh490 [Fistulifera solaris]
MTTSSSRPSDARRKSLRDSLSVPQVSNFFQLDRYYEAADKVFQSFQMAYKIASQGDIHDWNPARDSCLDDAYVYGKRYCIFCMEQLPQHGYYGTAKYAPLQRRHTLQMQKVVEQIEKVADIMDIYEEYKRKAAEERERRAAIERDRKHQEKLAAFQERFKQQQNADTTMDKNAIAASALDKLQNLQRFKENGSQSSQRQSAGEESRGKPSTKYSMLSDDDDDSNGGQDLPLPILPGAVPYVPMPPLAPPPPSYDQAFSATPSAPPQDGFVSARNVLGDDNQFGHGASAPLLSYHVPTDSNSKPLIRSSQKKIPLQTLQAQYELEYKRYIREGKITVSTINTFQGRISASTNGCTVISALVVSHHLKSPSVIQDSVVVHVIDRQCGPLLKEIRSKLGLGGHALIIPSDVHDHLVDQNLLPQDKFLGAAGGNILNSEHLQEFLKLLAQARNKAGATLFFREHVISLVKYYDKNGNSSSYSYDLIDSMPTHNGKATRTRCNGLDALLVLVRWYASRKFSSSDCHHVDRNEWEDNLADVDPRVFQGFVWGDAPQ